MLYLEESQRWSHWEGGAQGGGDQNGFVSAKLTPSTAKRQGEAAHAGRMRLSHGQGVTAGLSLPEPTGSESVTGNQRQIEPVREV